MKHKLLLTVAASAVFFFCGCGSSPDKLIVGKWESANTPTKVTAEFLPDSKAKLTILGQTLQGTYKLNASDELEWSMNGTTTKGKVKITANELELVSDGKTIKYKRV